MKTALRTAFRTPFTALVGAWLTSGLAGLAGLAMVLGASPVRAAEPPTAPILTIEAAMHTVMINRIGVDAGGRYVVTGSDDKTARVWDVSNGQLLRTLRPPVDAGNEGKVFAAAISPDGNTVAAAGWTRLGSPNGHTVYLFDRASGQLRGRLTGLPNVVLHLEYSADGRWLAATLGGENGVRVWDARAGGKPLEDTAYENQSYGAAFTTDGSRMATTSYDGKLRLYSVSQSGLTKTAEIVAPGGKRPSGLAFTPDGRQLAVGHIDSARVDVFDGATLALRFSADTTGIDGPNLSNVAWSPDGQTLYAAGRFSKDRHLVRRWSQGGRGPAVDTPATNDTIMAVTALPQGGVLVAGGDTTWGVVTANGQWQPRASAPSADLRGARKDAFVLGAAGAWVQFGYEPWGKPPHVFDLRGRTLSAGKIDGGQQARVEGLPVTDWLNDVAPKFGGKPLELARYETSRSLAILADNSGFVLGTDFRLRMYGADGKSKWDRETPAPVWGVNIPSAGRVVVAAYGDGTVRWHRITDGAELLTFFPHADRKRWVLWTPSGYYDASPGGEELIGWHLNRGADQAADFFAASRFRARFYRPDVIDRILDTQDEALALNQADQAGNRRQEATVSVATVLPPVVEVLGPSEVRTTLRQLPLKVRLRTAADAPVTGLRVRVNGQPVPVPTPAASGDTREFTVPVPDQDAEIQVFAENRHGVSSPTVVRVTWAGPAARGAVLAGTATGGAGANPGAGAGGFAIQPRLYVLAIGVGDYQHKDIGKLAFSAKDARDFAAALQKQQGRLYRSVEVRLLTDAQATRDDVVDGLDWLQKQVTQHDVGMLFVAGHGVNDPSLGYTFLPFNADPDRLKRTGVSMSDIRSTMATLAGKSVFFLDTCHSGNALGAGRRAGPNDISGVINDLASAENGVVVFSSSTGRQFSLEDPAWGNGAFTKALIEGLQGRAAFDGRRQITHKMLDLYISERVKQLTAGRQSPVTQAPGGVPDFPLAVN